VRRLRALLADAWPAMLAGAFFMLTVFRSSGDEGGRAAALLVGALYGVAVLGLVRLFRARSFGYLVAGTLSGPVPAALLLPDALPAAERGGACFVAAFLGLCVGLLEWAKVRRAAPGDAPRAS
jgi:hypothetical protein